MADSDDHFRSKVSQLDLNARVLAFAIGYALRAGRDDYAVEMGNHAWKLGVSKDDRRKVMDIINECFLAARELEWTSHGFKRSFRFWSEKEKAEYLDFANTVVGVLREKLTDKVCLGYGTALALARSNDLIPHDDDIDLIIAMPIAEYHSIAKAIPVVEQCLQQHGFSTVGSYVSHRHIRNPKGRSLDIFVGIEEGDFFSSFPGPRRTIRTTDLFPTGIVEIYGHQCRVPRDLDAYLSKVYGSTWKEPDPNFAHNWDRKPFADLLGV